MALPMRLLAFLVRKNSAVEDLATSRRGHGERLRDADVLPRLLRRDPTLWPESQRQEAASRLGWLDLPDATPRELPAWRALAAAARAEQVGTALLVGMGGSSLGAAVSTSLYPPANGAPLPIVCDSTHPDHVRALLDRLPPRRTWLIVATKSGTTAETRALAAVVRRWIQDAGGDPDRQSLAVTDAGSALARDATGWRAVLTPPSDVGGRFSVLSAYGLLLPTLAGVDVAPLLAAALRLLAKLREGDVEEVEPLIDMAALLAAAVEARWPLYLGADREALRTWPGWLEQLLAESLGKAGDGLLPVAVGSGHTYGHACVGAHFALSEPPAVYAALTRAGHIVRALPGPEAMGSEMLAWEIVTSLVGWCLHVSPFDQPDVERSKRAARQALARATDAVEPSLRVPEAAQSGGARSRLEAALLPWLEAAERGTYATVQLFARPDSMLAVAVDRFCGDLAAGLRRPVTWGYGPRYLHSTGQLHKGGPAVAVLQLLVPPRSADLAVPGEAFGLWGLLDAQAEGDVAALAASSRPVLRIELAGEPKDGIRHLERALHAVAPRSGIRL